MKSHMLFLQQVLDELGTWCHVSTIRDLKTITERVKHEGISFLTISLSNFGKDFERSLALGMIDHSAFTGFARSGGSPLFLGGFFDLVFDRSTGLILSTPNVHAIYAIRQISLMYGKIALECAPERVARAISRYVECESEVRASDSRVTPEEVQDFQRVGRLLWADMFSSIDGNIYYGRQAEKPITPKHGPGATAERLRSNAKYNQREWTARLERYFPMGEFVFSSWSLFLNDQDSCVFLEPGAERPVRVITVPKTLKTPRIIAIEPTCMQYVQQGILEAICVEIEQNDFARSFIRFVYQEPNQLLAREGSLTGKLATLDLSEASDRVSNRLVQALLAKHPHFLGAVDACRSSTAAVPGHGVLRLAKFASMGSALCFPFEAMVFCTIIFMAIERDLLASGALSRGTQLTHSSIRKFMGRVRVYGDDIIVPVKHAKSVMAYLEVFGLKVNASKSFWTGKFRESCGREYYDGHDVSIVRVRHTFPTSRDDATELVSTVSLRNLLYLKGFDKTVDWLDHRIGKIIPFPVVLPTSSALGRIDRFGSHDTDFTDPLTQRPFVKAAVISTRLPENILDGSGALMKYFLKRGDLPIFDRNHLLRSGRSVSFDIRIRRVSAV